MQRKETFGELIRQLREREGFPIRKVAAALDLDPSTLSKIERNDRSANREHLHLLAKLFNVSEKDLLVAYLSDKITYDLVEEDCYHEILHIAEAKIKYEKQKKLTQGSLNI